MPEYILNRLNPSQLAGLAVTSATLLAVLTRPSVKVELYYLEGHFIEISYCVAKRPDHSAPWRIYSANHYPDGPISTKYLAFFARHVKLVID